MGSARASAGQGWQTCPRGPQFGGLARTDFLKQLLLFAERTTMQPGSEQRADRVPASLWGRALAERLCTRSPAAPVPGPGRWAEAAGVAVGTWAWQR